VWNRGDAPGAAADGGLVVARGRPVTEAVRARPVPATAPAPVEASGACGEVVDAIRALQRTYPSGAMLPARANARFSTLLARLHRDCAATPAIEQAFRDRELTPWLTYLPPGA
jgi:hypothetical protein